MPVFSRDTFDRLRSLARRIHKPAATDTSCLSRRDFLTLSVAGGVAATMPTLSAGDFRVVQRGEVIHMLVDRETRWQLDATHFGANARATLLRRLDRIEITLTEAHFPGTSLSADLSVLLEYGGGRWKMLWVMANGLSASAELMPWLMRRTNAEGHWETGRLATSPHFSLRFAHPPKASLSADWEVKLVAPMAARLDGIPDRLHGMEALLTLNREGTTGESGRVTRVELKRGISAWPLDIRHVSPHGWSLDHQLDGALFDTAVVEAGEAGHTAVLHNSDAAPTLTFVPGTALLHDSGEPFAFALMNPRLALSLGNPESGGLLVSDMEHGPMWAHAPEASYLFSAASTSADAPEGTTPTAFEWAVGAPAPTASPQICKVLLPADDASLMMLHIAPRPSPPITWAKLAGPFERLFGWFHLLPSQHRPFQLLEGDHLHVERPADLLSLDFAFDNMEFVTGLHPEVRASQKGGSDARVRVIFPPQHIAETAYYDPGNLKDQVKLGPVEVNLVLGRPLNAPVTAKDESDAAKKLNADIADPPPAPSANAETHNRAKTFLAGETTLVFKPVAGKAIPLHLSGLLDWNGWTPVVSDLMTPPENLDKPFPIIKKPSGVTDIELPYRLHLSPDNNGRWAHAQMPVVRGAQTVELWHTRLGIKSTDPGRIDESNGPGRIARAIWSEDFAGVDVPPDQKGWLHANKPNRLSLDQRDRNELVYLTSDYNLKKRDYKSRQGLDQYLPPNPVHVDRLLLTSQGGYLSSNGTWDPVRVDDCHILTVEEWDHIATLGRDQYVRVVYKGYLMPFGLRASLIKVTERHFPKKDADHGVLATLRQQMFVLVRKQAKSFPQYGQPFAGRMIPWTVGTEGFLTPPLADPASLLWPNGGNYQTQSLFWPTVEVGGGGAGILVPFPHTFKDKRGRVTRAEFPAVFVGADVAQSAAPPAHPQTAVYTSADAVTFYNLGANTPYDLTQDDARRGVNFAAQTMAFAESLKPGDTDFEVGKIQFRVGSALPPDDNTKLKEADNLYSRDLPFFYPEVEYARLKSPAVKSISERSAPTRTVFYQRYLDAGFDPAQNQGELVLQVQDKDATQLAFGASSRVDQAGGLASPDVQVIAFSRKTGPVGGKHFNDTAHAPFVPGAPTVPVQRPSLDSYASGRFDPVDYFSGMLSAKLLGGIKLSDVLAVFAPDVAGSLAAAPRMVQEALQRLDKEEMQLVARIADFQANGNNVMAPFLAAQGAEVEAAGAAVRANPANLDQQARLAKGLIAYGAALEHLLVNPLETAQEALRMVLDRLTVGLRDKLITAFVALRKNIEAQANSAADNLIARLRAKLTTLKAALDRELKAELELFPILDAAGNVIPSDAGQQYKKRLLREAAPELARLARLIDTVDDLIARLTALSSLPSLAAMPGYITDLGAAFTDVNTLLQMVGAPAIAAGWNVDAAKQKWFDLRNAGIEIWKQITIDEAMLLDFAATCSAVAETAADDARNVMQAYRKLQKSVEQLRGLKSLTVTVTATGAATLTKAPRWIRVFTDLRSLQGTILAALADIQHACEELDRAHLSTPASIKLNAMTRTLAVTLTIADKIDLTAAGANLFTKARNALLVDSDLARSYTARLNQLDTELTVVRGLYVPNQPGDVARLLQIYMTGLEYHAALAAALQLDAYRGPIADLETFATDAADSLQKIQAMADSLSAQVSASLCTLNGSVQGLYLQLTGSQDFTTKTLAKQFGKSLKGVSDAFTTLCGAPLTTPATLAAAQTILRSLVVLSEDVRQQIANAPKEIAAALESEARTLLADLLKNPPIPTGFDTSYTWTAQLKPLEPVFTLGPTAAFKISAHAVAKINVAQLQTSPVSADLNVEAKLTDFSVNLVGAPSFVIVKVKSLTFSSSNLKKSDVRLDIDNVTLGRDMAFVKSLGDLLNPSSGPFIELADACVRAGYRFALPSTTVGAFSLTQLAFEVAVSLPFNGDPVRCQFQISDHQHPFLLSAGIYGGGGFLALHLGLDGVELLQGALEFGLVGGLHIGPVSGSGFIVAGIYFSIGKGDSTVCGFLHAHGHVDVFGLISLDVDLYVSLCYSNGSVIGQATLKIQISIAFFSKTFEFHVQYTFAGSGGGNHVRALPESRYRAPTQPRPFVGKGAWKDYVSAFAPIDPTFAQLIS